MDILEDDVDDKDINVDFGSVMDTRIGSMHSQHINCLLGILPAWVLTYHSFKVGNREKNNFLNLLSFSGVTKDELCGIDNTKLNSIAKSLQISITKEFGIQITEKIVENIICKLKRIYNQESGQFEIDCSNDTRFNDTRLGLNILWKIDYIRPITGSNPTSWILSHRTSEKEEWITGDENVGIIINIKEMMNVNNSDRVVLAESSCQSTKQSIVKRYKTHNWNTQRKRKFELIIGGDIGGTADSELDVDLHHDSDSDSVIDSDISGDSDTGGASGDESDSDSDSSDDEITLSPLTQRRNDNVNVKVGRSILVKWNDNKHYKCIILSKYSSTHYNVRYEGNTDQKSVHDLSRVVWKKLKE
ncbi:hypothetical protein FRACYDRAFT_237741 [Fragilariopsis cylindrus CCMP1102]|uniref:Tudor domain-containing protein n=1 Tax=Fragilariopsis cylindrus CCMP1102 TaxID=635003 RepID=A0A1E7FGM9_9STRA|nr:hypothetical protein FRACYDRAFT_237741 [Fragilariopsis cylindrus CCMP1102]|eukprot:OEU17330.1 hypothetical protein FRACYDRAFT_237741 [Fragilariopsis cylindrus CCMP1102]